MSGNGEDEDMSFLKHDGLPTVLPVPKGPKTKFGPAEDATLIQLKEHWNFTWKQIQHWFPGRTNGTLQVRYCTKLKAKNVVWTEEMVCLFPLHPMSNLLTYPIGHATEQGNRRL